MSLTVNGIRKPYIRALRGSKRPAWAPINRILLKVPGMPGAYHEDNEIEPVVIPVKVRLERTEELDLNKVKEDMAAWLVTDRAAEFIFDSEPDRKVYGMVDGSLDLEEFVDTGKGSFNIICPDPYKYSTEEKSISWPELKVFKQDFTGKVAGSTVENPHKASATAVTTLKSPIDPWPEFTQGRYDQITSLNGVTSNYGYSVTSGNIPQHLFSFNLIAAIERRFGAIPAADKVAWLKANIKKLTANWYGKGTNKMNNPNGKTNFAGKVAGSVTANANIAKRGAQSTYATPTSGLVELTGQSEYDKLFSLDGQTQGSGGAPTTHANIGQMMFSFNLIEYIKRKYGYTPTAQWLKENISRITVWHYGNGTGPNGNKLYLTMWREDQAAWYNSPVSHAQGSPTQLGLSTNFANVFVDSNGFYHALVYADASNGTAASAVYTDFVELEVELKPGADKATLSAWSSTGSNWWSPPATYTGTNISRVVISTTQISATPSIAMNFLIDSNGFVHYLANAEPSNGIAASTIETDYIELEIETNVPYLPIVVNNMGTADAKPIFTAMVKAPITHLDIVTEEGYMRIGEPVNIEETPVEREQLILKETLKTTTGWATANDVDGGSIAGTMVSDGETFRAQSYGTGSLWHGPALKKSLPEQIQDFKVDMYASLKTKDVREAGRVELYLRDVNDKVIGKLALKEMLTASDSVHGEARAGGIDGGQFLISTDGATPGVWNQFYGILRLTRIGDRLQAYIAKIDTATGNRHTRWLSKEIIDSQGLFQAKLAQIQIHLGQHGSKAFVQDIGVHEVQVYKINQTTETQIPYIAYPGDIIEIDMIEEDIRINGEARVDLKDFGSSFFALQPGENIITYSNYDVVDLKIDWREPFK
ncbi:distal tail protein Dit [Cytobacillus oceanisediminis]|uniref:distal tail protein Dit n=1 Tax=Cytobacillus oceanisediminis TaxID=665099 RepID=UPI001C21897B|nr:distal tail protein Dit [Cytobacillus oceanisediminis]MBU8773181.1 phage tail family protein [Cytobacillus oceanisediminis]